MSRLPENPAQLPVVLHSRHQWLRWRGMLLAGIIGMAATLVALWTARSLWPSPLPGLAELWVGGLAITLLAVGVASRFSPRSLLATARLLDGRFAAKGRLEAAAVLKDSTSPLAVAQREETEAYLARETHARAVRVLPWLRGMLIALVLAHLLTLLLWIVPTFSLSTKPAVAAKPPPKSAGATESSITWQTPEPATQANPVEEVPASATVESPTGLKDLKLEVSVNGEIKKSIPIPEETAIAPGSHEIKVALHLNDLKVQPFDVVSYYLHGQPVSAENQPDITSPVQFVQVRPFRDASTPTSPPANAPGSPPPDDASQILSQLELAELHVMQDNFQLAHSELQPNDPARAQEDHRVGKEQAELSSQTEQIAKTLADEHFSASTTDPLHQAEPLMDDSGKKILANQNETAASTQQQALNLIIRGEKSVYQAATTAAPAATPKSDQSFTDSPPHQLTPRDQTLLGQLETLAKDQSHLAQDMSSQSDDSSPAPPPETSMSASPAPTAPTPAATNPNPTASPLTAPVSPPVDPFGPDADKGSLAERQERVIKGIATLQNETKTLPPAGADALASAQKDGATALQQLSAEQPDAAREPAAAAALDLQQTLQALNQTGADETKQALAQAQQQLNSVASQLRGMAQNRPADASPRLMDLATEVHNVQQGLESAADQQQNAGSAQGATQMNQLASQLQDQKIASNLAAMSKSGLDPGRANTEADAIENLAGQAASGMMPAQPSPQDYAGLANSLERSEANLANLADMASPNASGTSSDTDTAPYTSGSQPGQETGQQSTGNTPGNSSGSQPGQQPGQQAGQQAAGNTPGNSSGSQPGQQPGQQAGQQAAGNTPGNSPGSQSGQQPGQQPGQQAIGNTPGNTPGSQPGQPAPPTDADAATAQAYREVLQDLKNETQQTVKAVPGANAAAVNQIIMRYDKDTSYRDVKGVDIVRFHTDLQQPLEKLIIDVQALQQHAQRGEIVQTPDLDETPAAYRPAVSRYFEDVSRDYHSPTAPAPSKP
jgi:hypothetical protein